MALLLKKQVLACFTPAPTHVVDKMSWDHHSLIPTISSESNAPKNSQRRNIQHTCEYRHDPFYFDNHQTNCFSKKQN
jgi:hypothetical protein